MQQLILASDAALTAAEWCPVRLVDGIGVPERLISI